MPGSLLSVDVGAAGAVVRIALGGGLVIVLRQLFPGIGHAAAAAALAMMLFAVKALAAVARRFVAAGPEARAASEWRRNLARHHDSYQWRKLVWYGVGMLGVEVVTGPPSEWARYLGVACFVSGMAAEWVWRRKGLPLVPPSRG